MNLKLVAFLICISNFIYSQSNLNGFLYGKVVSDSIPLVEVEIVNV